MKEIKINYSLYYRLWSQITSKRRRQFILLFLIMLGASLSEVISLGALFPFLTVLSSPEKIYNNLLLKQIFSFFNLNNPRQLILPSTIIFCSSVLFAGLMRLILLWYQTKISYAVGADFSYKTYRNALYQPYASHLKQNSSEIISVLSKASALSGTIILPIFSILSSIIMLIMLITTIIYINPFIALFSISGFGLIYFIIIKFTKEKLSLNSKKVSTESIKIVKSIQEGLGGIRDVLIDGTQETFCEVFKNSDIPSRNAQANILIIGASPRFIIESVGMILIAILAYSMSADKTNFFKAIPTIGALALGAQRILPVLQLIFSSWTIIKGNEASLLDAITELEKESPKKQKCIIEPIKFNDSIILNDLSFRFNENEKYVLDNINFEIVKGEKIGIIGVTGSGKSTMLDLIMGLLTPTHGQIKIDGVEINAENNRAWQKHIAHVPQSIYLSDSTIAENIAFGIPFSQIDFRKVEIAAKKARISDSIESWNDKYNTLVGERGVRLSGGQRQRIGIARALYKNADVIIFDEATSALDSKTEEDVMNAINSLDENLTIIIIAHRITTLKNCNKIISIKNGKIEKCGSYFEIIKSQS